MNPAIKAIIFDFGNVLAFFNYKPTFQQLRPHTPLNEEEMRAAIAASDLHDTYESGQISSEEFLNRVARLCKLCCPQETLISAWSNIFWANKEVQDLIPKLKSNYRLLLGSNTNELHARQFRRQFNDVLRHFDDLVLSYEVGAMKPKAEFFRRCHELADCEPAECVFIDDLAANIEGARAYGLQGIIYKDIIGLREEFRNVGINI